MSYNSMSLNAMMVVAKDNLWNSDSKTEHIWKTETKP